jgi:hypothetical protein
MLRPGFPSAAASNEKEADEAFVLPPHEAKEEEIDGQRKTMR